MKENSMKSSVCMLAFAAGKVSTEGNAPKLYSGVGSVYVLGVNPNKAAMEKLFNREYEEEPNYLGEQEINGEKIPTVRLSFVIKTDPEKNHGIELTSMYTLFLRKEYRYNRDKTKVQVIDKYGRTCWVTIEQAKNHEIPMYSNGPANIDKDYRPCYVGEEDLVKFLIAYLNIPNPMKYINGSWEMVEHPEDSEAGLEKIADYFKGDFKEIKSIIALQPKNKLKLAFGVRATDDNKQYQTFYTGMPMKNGVTDYSRLDKEIQERQANGGLSTSEFSVEDLHEYSVESTDFTNNKSESNDLPFGPADEAASPWFSK